MMRSTTLGFALPLCLVVTVGSGCAHAPKFKPRSSRSTCVVLSMGDVHGLAHIGALKAATDAGLKIDCVTGTSMGALIGGLYASAPDEDPADRFSAFMAAYIKETKTSTAGAGLIGALILGGLVVATGGGALVAVGAAAAGGLGGAMTVDPVELRRTAKIYDEFVGRAKIEELPVRYATWYEEVTGTSARMVTVTDGSLAQGVKRSIANPAVFDEVNPVREGYVDPGVDRIAATPVRDTCQLYPQAQILAINVTGQDIELAGATCAVQEVRIEMIIKDSARKNAMRGKGPEFDALVEFGYQATCEALGSCQ